jgi:hypothetical protein
MNEDEDRTRSHIMKCAAACLDHIRTVRWGQARSIYQETEGELELHVFIEVKCLSRATKETKT